MCKKINFKIECSKCGYPYLKAKYQDDYDNPLSCNEMDKVYLEHIKDINRLKLTQQQHHYDCKCLICR